MAKVVFGNHSSVLVPRQDRDSIRKFYCDVLGGTLTKADPERDFVRLGDNFYIVFLYGDVADESGFLRTARSVWLEIKSDGRGGTRGCGFFEVPYALRRKYLGDPRDGTSQANPR